MHLRVFETLMSASLCGQRAVFVSNKIKMCMFPIHKKTCVTTNKNLAMPITSTAQLPLLLASRYPPPLPIIVYSLRSFLIDSGLVQFCTKFESIKRDRRKQEIASYRPSQLRTIIHPLNPPTRHFHQLSKDNTIRPHCFPSSADQNHTTQIPSSNTPLVLLKIECFIVSSCGHF